MPPCMGSTGVVQEWGQSLCCWLWLLLGWPCWAGGTWGNSGKADGEFSLWLLPSDTCKGIKKKMKPSSWRSVAEGQELTETGCSRGNSTGCMGRIVNSEDGRTQSRGFASEVPTLEDFKTFCGWGPVSLHLVWLQAEGCSDVLHRSCPACAYLCQFFVHEHITWLQLSSSHVQISTTGP